MSVINNTAKEIIIEVPEGYEIDKENSTIKHIKFKKKDLNYKDIFELLNAKYKQTYEFDSVSTLASICFSEKQLNKILAINKLLNVVKYFNDDWKPTRDSYGYCITIGINNEILILPTCTNNKVIYFKTKEIAEKVIEIVGKDTIYLAFSTDW